MVETICPTFAHRKLSTLLSLFSKLTCCIKEPRDNISNCTFDPINFTNDSCYRLHHMMRYKSHSKQIYSFSVFICTNFIPLKCLLPLNSPVSLQPRSVQLLQLLPYCLRLHVLHLHRRTAFERNDIPANYHLLSLHTYQQICK